jgi:hypothetical protein
MSEEPENLLCALFAADGQSVSHQWLTIGIGATIECVRGIDRRHSAMMHCQAIARARSPGCFQS